MSEALPRGVRLRKRLAFLDVQERGKRITAGPLVGLVAPSPDGRSRLGLTVSSKVGTAVVRNAVRRRLRELLRSELASAKDPIKAPLAEVVEAADTVQIGALRRDAVAAVDDLKAKGSDSRRNLDFWGQVGVGAVALGCVSAAALGQVAIGIPCVIGGSASQGLLSFWQKNQQ